MNNKIAVLLSVIVAGVGFGGRGDAQAQSPSSKKRSVAQYLAQLAPMMVGRPLSQAERLRAESEGSAAVEPTVRSWTRDARFLESVRAFTQSRLSLSGKSGDIDYDAPADLAVFLERTGKPYAGFLTHDTCIDASGRTKACDTGAPFVAGVLTMRAFLAKYGGPFNISRAAQMLRKFTCAEYPLSQDTEPSVPAKNLIPMFAATQSNLNFGFGNNCYMCHGQFAKHTQLFVKFDAFGRYVPGATGVQDPNPQTAGGVSTGLTFVTHFADASRGAKESSEMFGKPVSNLAEAASAIVEHPSFNQCTTRWVLAHYLRLKDTTFHAVPKALLEKIVTGALVSAPTPTLGDLVVAALSDPIVIESYTAHGKQGDLE